jgi:hypothetical protein
LCISLHALCRRIQASLAMQLHNHADATCESYGQLQLQLLAPSTVLHQKAHFSAAATLNQPYGGLKVYFAGAPLLKNTHTMLLQPTTRSPWLAREFAPPQLHALHKRLCRMLHVTACGNLGPSIQQNPATPRTSAIHQQLTLNMHHPHRRARWIPFLLAPRMNPLCSSQSCVSTPKPIKHLAYCC